MTISTDGFKRGLGNFLQINSTIDINHDIWTESASSEMHSPDCGEQPRGQAATFVPSFCGFLGTYGWSRCDTGSWIFWTFLGALQQDSYVHIIHDNNLSQHCICKPSS